MGLLESMLSGDKSWYLNGEEVTEEEVMGIAKWVLAEEGVRVDNTEDNVNSPSHYNQSGIECIDAIKASLGDGVSGLLQR